MTQFVQIGKKKPVQWSSIEDYEGQKAALEATDSDSPNAQLAAERDLSRRGFLGWSGATVAGASALLSGCIRKAEEQILPYARRPEDYIPGEPAYFATAASIGGSVVGLLVESQDGRPTKIDGNPRHPGSGKGSTAWAQAEVMELYDNARTQKPVTGGSESTWDAWDAFAASAFKGPGTAVLLDETTSPSVQRVLASFVRKSGAKVYAHGPGHRANTFAGADAVGLTGLQPVYDLAKAKVIVSLDSDFLGVDGDCIANSAGFAAGRRVADSSASMSRLYSVEAGFSITGMAADNRLRLASSQVRGFLITLAKAIFAGGVSAPAGAESIVSGLRASPQDPTAEKWITTLAKDLSDNKGAGVLVVGERQPASVHALAHLVNAALGNVGGPVGFVARNTVAGAGDIAALAEAINGGSVKNLLILGGNPVSRAPGALGFGDLMAKAGTTIHVGMRNNATGKKATWHLPTSHFLESWGDHRSTDGTLSVQQPLIEPLYGTRSILELLGGLTGEGTGGLALVRKTWPDLNDAGWRKALHEGVVSGSTGDFVSPGAVAAAAPTDGDAVDGEPAPVAVSAHNWSWSNTNAILGKAHTTAGESGFEVNWTLAYGILDGRYLNNPWLQELPDPMTKVAWDNVAQVSPKMASSLGVKHGDWLNLELEGRSLNIPVVITPGVAENAVMLALGYGEGDLGYYALEGKGFDANSLRGAAWPAFQMGVGVSKTSGPDYELALTQKHHRMDPGFGYPSRPLVRENTLAEFKEDPDFVQGFELFPEEKLKSLWKQPNVTTGQQWGKSIDLNLCTGCNSCTVACQAENNISVVGKERVAYGREMHWIRIDRYFTGDPDDPEAVVQPIACAHCETAPCEGVCPVAATSHGPEGLNDIAYNRCIGTRYCANNCPYKVRRYNFFAYAKDEDTQNPNLTLQRNPDVTVRFRGVVEKCSYCVQRINAAKIVAKRSGNGKVPDGGVVPACAQACPTDAIVFGDQNDPDTAVSKEKANSRNYALLAELNIHPRTTFLARIRNPNPELA